MTKGYDAPTDPEILAEIARGDPRAFETLHRRFRSRIARFAFRVVQRHDLAEEVTNDVFMVVWRRAADFEGRSAVSTWILGIAYRVALKARGRISRMNCGDADIAAIADDERTDIVERALVARRLGAALSALSEPQRAMIELSYRFGYQVDEIASVVGCPPGTVKSRLFKARSQLRAKLGDGTSAKQAA